MGEKPVEESREDSQDVKAHRHPGFRRSPAAASCVLPRSSAR
jgi:hypothetical protein